jgi:hypothetical protein
MMIGDDTIHWDDEIYCESFGTVSQYWRCPVPFYLNHTKKFGFLKLKKFSNPNAGAP